VKFDALKLVRVAIFFTAFHLEGVVDVFWDSGAWVGRARPQPGGEHIYIYIYMYIYIIY
jgi:hypothetical protein